jgi:beta-lactam-binding protein with PASTA domain
MAANSADVIARPANGPMVRPEITPAGGPPVMPDVRGLSARDALRVLGAAGLLVRVSGSGVVAEQTPPPGAAIGAGAWSAVELRRGAR